MNADLEICLDLLDEQEKGAVARAAAGADGKSITFIGKGEHLALLFVDDKGARKKTYLCKVIEVR